MPVSRRSFVHALSLGGAGVLGAPFIAARGHEAWGRALADDAMSAPLDDDPAGPLRLQSNENPHGPSSTALAAVRDALAGASRYPRGPEAMLQEAIAARHGVPTGQILLGAGSGEILRMAAYAFLSPAKALVTAAPSFEDPVRYAKLLGATVHEVPVDARLRLDPDAMAERAVGAGMVFFCNPNNPTGTVHGEAAVADFVARVRRVSPDTIIVIDEAYHEYVEEPTYASAIPLALADPRVVVTRTFSKVYGMAGLRVGWAIGAAETLAAMRRHRLGNSVNVLGSAAALASLADGAFVTEQRRLNREARELTRRAFADAGHHVTPSECNFLMVDVRRDVREFQKACQERGILVGRPFPPLLTRARISIGTQAEMRRAVGVFREVLAG
jgi:histidinol-phosphate aminotransferase